MVNLKIVPMLYTYNPQSGTLAMLKKNAPVLSILLLVATLGGCSKHAYDLVEDADLVEVSYDAVDELQDRLSQKLPKNSLIVVSTLLNVDNLNKTSAFGRIISDQIASAFHKEGHRIIGMEMPIDLFSMKENGSLELSDDTKKLLVSHKAGILVGGVYAPGKRNTYVSLRAIDLVTKSIISSADLSVPMGPDAKLLTQPRDVGSKNTEQTRTETQAGDEPEKEPEAPEIIEENY